MADCLAIRSCGTVLAGSSSVHQVSLTSGRIALLKVPVPCGAGKKRREGTKRTTQLTRRVACSPTRDGLGDDKNKEKSSSSPFSSEDWVHLGKVFAGSILLPQITQPNLVIALLIITAPVVASVVVLNAASSKSSDS